MINDQTYCSCPCFLTCDAKPLLIKSQAAVDKADPTAYPVIRGGALAMINNS